MRDGLRELEHSVNARAGAMTVAVDLDDAGMEQQGLTACCGAQKLQHLPSQQPAAPQGLSGNWHLRLASLLVTLRGCLMGPDRDFFDRVHASAHKREIPTHQFFSYALDVLRQHKPELEDDFREVFRLRNASRRRARQHKAGTMRSVKSESALQDVVQPRGSAMSRSCDDVAGQARSAEDVDETMFRLQALCMQASTSKACTVLTKRHSEISMHAECENKRKPGVSQSFDIISTLP